MTFMQVIDCKTRRIDELNRLMDTWVEATRGKRTATHSIVGRDRADSTHVVEIVEFPSHEEAVKNSHLPETDRIFREMVDLCEGEPSFTDLDVMRDEQLNKIVVRGFFEDVINKGNIDAVDAMCTSDYREHDPAMSSYDLGLAQAKAENKEIMAALQPELTIESMTAEGDTVCVRLSVKGRHVGTFEGVKATGKEFAGTGQVTFRCEGGKLAESWWNMDERGLMQQLGALKS
ncbi:ester cyclase [Streptomyces sp. NBC_01186]|uniref:ester cyclase n=1 Tax=unclassified Streptomyces TaxID=2593676 RepID=UPI002DD954AD|nr:MULTISPECIES: ester cyclase [unclassified Streptomyces]WSB79441.1 ester cyclase [Streptomyces sp. NBC_01775]WSS12354.1 ester cyclase [Streptomyces sp. NBC_01186]